MSSQNSEDTTVLLKAAAVTMQTTEYEYKWQMYMAAAELLHQHDLGAVNLHAMPQTKRLIKVLLGHEIEGPPIEAIRRRVDEVIRI